MTNLAYFDTSSITDISDVEIKNIINSVKKEDVDDISTNVYKDTKIAVVYNPFSMDSAISASVIKKHIDGVTVVSFQDIVPTDSDYTIWLGVKEFSKMNRKGIDIVFDSTQPYWSKPKTGFIAKLKGAHKLTQKQIFNNKLIEVVNGKASDDEYFQELAKTCLLDKVMLHFGIKSDGRYGLSYLARSITDIGDISSYSYVFYTYKNALEYIEDKASSYMGGPSEHLEMSFIDELKFYTSSLSNKITTKAVVTVNGKERCAIGSLSPIEYNIAKYLYNRSGGKILNIVHGLSGSFFYGDVVLAKGMQLGDVKDSIDC